MDENSFLLTQALGQYKGDIIWAKHVLDIFETIKSIYSACKQIEKAPNSILEFEDKVKELEKYLLIDLERHVATQNGRSPYYINRIQERLTGSLALLHGCVKDAKDGLQLSSDHKQMKDLDHFSAALQAAIVEFGFCSVYDVLHDVDEITRALDSVSLKIDNIESSAKGDMVDEAVLITELRHAIASQHGIQQSITENNLRKVQGKYDDITKRLLVLENNICKGQLNSESVRLKKYVEFQGNLKKDLFTLIYNHDPSHIIDDHMVHPGTRAWLLDRVNRWFHKTAKRIFYLGAQSGAGKTAMASTICKLYGSDVIACHFFDATAGDTKANSITGLVQNLIWDMCHTLPEYANYLLEHFDTDALKGNLVNGTWKDTFERLLKTPLRSIYGHGSKQRVRRKLIVIDGLDECNPSQYRDIKSFLKQFTSALPARFCMFVTSNSQQVGQMVDMDDYDDVEGVKLEDKIWMTYHIKDVEIYISSSLGAILSGEDEADAPFRAKADASTLQNTVDELLKSSSGRFDIAIELMESFAREMRTSKGQFLSSLKKAISPVREAHGNSFDQQMSSFSSPFRSYRDKEGRSVTVRIMRQSQFPMDKTRVALIRAHHKMN